MDFTGNKKRKTTFILGAGFSKCADLPIQAEFSPLLTSSEFNSPIDKAITQIIVSFLEEIFGWREGREIPSLEDIFTFIDLSAGNEHYLGASYHPLKLHALRRMLIYRIFQILDKKFNICPEIRNLLEYYKQDDCSFVVVNWDIVLEKHLLAINEGAAINYITPSYEWNNSSNGNPPAGIKICKMHGSSNWVYCENCKALYYQIDQKLSLHKKVGVNKNDFLLFGHELEDAHFHSSSNSWTTYKDTCKNCGNELASHIATFSFRKSFRTAAYSAIWYEAENLLAAADQWIFIGYSLPEADFELKHLIKSAEHRIPGKKRKIDAVLYQDKFAKDKFERFFGFENITVYDHGLKEYVNNFAENKSNPLL